MCRTRRMSHEENTLPVDIIVSRMRMHPFGGGSDIQGRAGIGRVAGEAVANVHANDAVASEVIENVGVNLLCPIAMPTHERTTMNEQDRCAGGAVLRRGENIKFLTLVTAIGTVPMHGYTFRRRIRQHLRKPFEHEIHVAGYALVPARADVRHERPE